MFLTAFLLTPNLPICLFPCWTPLRLQMHHLCAHRNWNMYIPTTPVNLPIRVENELERSPAPRLCCAEDVTKTLAITAVLIKSTNVRTVVMPEERCTRTNEMQHLKHWMACVDEDAERSKNHFAGVYDREGKYMNRGSLEKMHLRCVFRIQVSADGGLNHWSDIPKHWFWYFNFFGNNLYLEWS